MRVIQLTAGTGTFHCGTCHRDNALVRALRDLGHDAGMVPLYLPLHTELPDESSESPVFLGGINVWLQHRYTVFRRLPSFADRALSARPVLQLAARRAGMTRPEELGDMTVAMLRGPDGPHRKEVQRLARWIADRPHPDAIVLSNALLAGLAGPLRTATGAHVACTLQGEDTFLDALPEPARTAAWAELRRRAHHVARFVAVSRYHAGVMSARLDLPEDRVAVVPNGIPLDGHAESPTPPERPAIGFLAHLCADKGLHTLVDAFVLLRERGVDAVLRAAGALTDMDRPFVEGLKERLAAAGLAGDASFHPNLTRDEKLAFLRGLSVLSVPATYGESFGLYVLEALASGVPVVEPRCAAFPEVLEMTGGGLLCEPDDPGDLASKLASLVTDPDRARALGRQGREAVHARFGADRMAKDVAEVLASLRPLS
jgi:glycosyltransferase involved in cell wall biosynthesis